MLVKEVIFPKQSLEIYQIKSPLIQKKHDRLLDFRYGKKSIETIMNPNSGKNVSNVSSYELPDITQEQIHGALNIMKLQEQSINA